MRFHNSHTITLQPGFRFSLSMHIFGLHSRNRCWIFNFLFIYFSILIFHGISLLSLSKQVVSSHSPCRCLVCTLQSDVCFFSLNFQEVSYFLYSHSPTRFKVSLSMPIFGLHSPSRCWISKFFFFFFFNHNFS